MPSRNTIEIVIEGEDRASKVLKNVNNSLDTLGKASLGIIVGGIGAATAAVAGFGAKALSEFTTFQKGMSEVFTLLPGITEESMSKLEEQAQRVAAQFGVLPNEVVPAMYQAISAGVPKDNVFDFLSVASKAAVGGVTTLETAVDGISSVVNAYGAEVLSAAQASDYMFTAVRLGKTDFNQLSSSLFNVIPTAASLGIGLDQVSAALAVITAQGTPTSVATTQLRQLFVELSKEGTKLSDSFLEISGTSFIDFIKQGGNVSEALEMIRKEVGDDAFRNMFGSVEALNAALGIAGPNAENFANALGEMGNSAGATDAAFETMSRTIAFQANRLQAKLSNMFINVGRQFEPFAADAVEAIGDVVSAFDALLSGDTDVFSDLEAWDENIRPLIQFLALVKPQFDDLKDTISSFFQAIGAGVPFVDALVVAIFELLPEDLRDGFSSFIILLQQFGAEINKILTPIIAWVQENIKLQDVLVVIAGAIAGVVIPAIASLLAAFASFAAPILAIIGLVALVRQAWESDFLGIRSFILDIALPALQEFANWFTTVGLPTIIQKIGEFITSLGEFVSNHTDFLVAIAAITGVLGGLHIAAAIIPAAIGAITSAVGFLLSPVVILTAAIAALLFAVSELYPGGLSGVLRDAATAAQQLGFILTFVLNRATQAATDIVNIFIIKLNEAKTAVESFVSGINESLTGISGIANLLGSGQVNFGDVLRAAGVQGFANGIDFIPTDRIVKVHRGEGILTAQENQDRLSGNTSSTSNTFQIIINAPMTQHQANETSQNYVTALRNQGIDL